MTQNVKEKHITAVYIKPMVHFLFKSMQVTPKKLNKSKPT